MNWKWEDKVDFAREKQRAYEDAKRKEIAQAKSAGDLRKIERNLGKSLSVSDLMRVAQEREREAYMDALRYMHTATISWPMPEDYRPVPPKPLPEEHVVAAIVGYRAWNVPLFVDELRSVAKTSKWLPRQRFSAQCESSQCSGVSCTCGIYAFNKLDLVQKEYRQEDRSKRYVYGECWLWGRVLECEKGYRAQFAYPKAFINNGAIAKRMAEIFGVALL